jgi:hypothetical protein
MPPRTRDARRALLIGVTTYVAMQAILIVVLAWGAPWLRDPPYGLRTTRLQQRIKKAPRRPLVVAMLGSSRTALAVDGKSAESILNREGDGPVLVQNFGRYGGGTFTNLLTLRRLLDDGLRPDLVLMETIPFFLSAGAVPQDLSEKYLPFASLRRQELPLVRSHFLSGDVPSDQDWWLSWTSPTNAHRLTLLSHSVPLLLQHGDRSDGTRRSDVHGWMPLAPPNASEEQRRKVVETARETVKANITSPEVGGPAVELLREGLDLCRRERIPVAVILMPESPRYLTAYPRPFLEHVSALLDELKSRHGVPTIDAREWVGEDGFLDGHHLLSPAATQFSERLARESLRPLLRNLKGGRP